MAATGASKPAAAPDVRRPDASESRTSGRSAAGTPKRSSSPSSHAIVSTSRTRLRHAFDGSLTCPAPADRCQPSQQATSPKASSPVCARASRAGSRPNSHASFGAENVGSSARPVTAPTRSAPGRPASARHSSSARWSCQLTIGVTARPESRSQSTKVSVWFAIPIPATSAPAASRASPIAASAPARTASGSCSTMPGPGRDVSTLRTADATTSSRAS
jgi:hypothetical protein